MSATPFFVAEPLRSFFLIHDLGPMYFRLAGRRGVICNPGPPLSSVLVLLANHGIATVALLRSLFEVYIHHRQLSDPRYPLFFRLDASLTHLINSFVSEPLEEGTLFPSTGLDHLIASARIPNNHFSVDELYLLLSAATATEVARETQLVRSALQCIRLFEEEE